MMHYTENDQIKVALKAAYFLEYASGDREFPKGIYIEFFDEVGKQTNSLKANQGYYFKKENQWRGRGNVIVNNIEKNEKLTTEELFWKPDTKKIFTEKFVTITLHEEVIYGTGLEALQDLTYYKITHPGGEFTIDNK